MLYLTYDINSMTDGMGAQYQRILGIICICEFYNIKYVHTKIKKMEHLDNLNYLNDIEEFFQIYNNFNSVESVFFDETFNEYNPSIDNLFKYKNNEKNILVKIALPYNICENNIKIYENIMPKLKKLLKNNFLPFYKNNNNKKIAIHIRRGDVSNSQNTNRYVSIKEIIKIITYFKKLYNNCSFYLFTEIDNNNKNEFDIFNNDNSINIKANQDQILTLNHLINADILVICKSSFSYIAGLYNTNTVYYFDFWHTPLTNWKNINSIKTIETFNNSKNYKNYLIIILILIILFLIKNYIKKINLLISIIVIIFLINYLFNNENFSNNQKYTAVIIEPRKHKALSFVLKNFTQFLDNRWNFIIFHGNQNEDFIKNIINTELYNHKNRIKLINLNVDNLSIHDYNTLLYDKTFYNNIPTEIFLIFQTDTMICEKYKDNIYKYLNYDYVGAPWTNQEVGNGGLSLRKKSKMLEIINTCSDKKNYTATQLHNEDAFFSSVCKDKVNISKPNFEDAKQFGIETVYSDKTFGIHKAWGYINQNELNQINDYCPGLLELQKLNK